MNKHAYNTGATTAAAANTAKTPLPAIIAGIVLFCTICYQLATY